ncbi:MAG: LolA family protein [Chloroflexota bacterium]
MVRNLALVVLATFALILGACAAPAGPATTPAPVAQATTAPPPAATPASATPTTAPPTPTATVAPTRTPAPTATPTKAASAGGSAVLDKLKTIRSFSADITVGTAGETTKGKIAYANKKMRMDVEAEGMRVAIFIDPDKKVGYMYNPAEKAALALPYDEATKDSADPGEMLNWEANMTAPPKLLGEETVDGKACVVYEFTTADGKSKSWLDKTTGFPLKNESPGDDGEIVTTRFSNVQINNVPDSQVTLPPGTEILDLSGLVATPAPAGTRPTPIPARVWPTPTGGSAGGLRPAAITGAVPAVLKENVPIPSGFKLVPYSAGRMDDADTDTFEAKGNWTGDADMQDIADFYTYMLAQGWVPRGGVVNNAKVEIRFDQKNTDPVVSLLVEAEPDDDGVILTLTMTNAEA